MTKLTFNSNKSLKSLARETLKASQFKVPYEDRTTDEKGFFLVKDEGIYLMNAFKATNGKTPKENGFVVYASGYNPKYDKGDLWDRTHDISGDDFAEFIPFDEEALMRIASGGNVYIRLNEETLEITA